MALSVADMIADAVGFGGGLVVSASWLPQIYRARKRRSTRDLSYSWQVTIAVGLAMQLVYLAYFDLWAVLIPLTGELILILYLFGFKLSLESFSHEGAKAIRDEPTTAGIDAVRRGLADETSAPGSHSPSRPRTAGQNEETTGTG